MRRYVRQVEATRGCVRICRPRLNTREIRTLRKELFELRRANEIPKAARVFFATGLDADRTR